MNECEVYFRLSGENFDPTIVVGKIDLDGATIKQKGDPIPKSSSWIFSSGRAKSELIDVYEMAAAVVSKLIPHTNSLVDLKNTNGLDAVLQVVMTFSPDEEKSMPAIGFDGDVLAFLSAVGATIDIDTYRG